VRPEERFKGLDVLVADRGGALLATATLACRKPGGRGGPAPGRPGTANRHWHRVRDQPEIYLRRTIYHLAVDQWRYRRRHPVVLSRAGTDLDAAAQPDGTDMVHLRLALIQGLAQLPPRQRAVLVLPYWDQLSESEAADVLGCSLGTVKSSASRGLARLREVTTAWAIESAPAENPLANGASS